MEIIYTPSSYRDFAGEVKNTVGEAHDRIWYTGEWGMHYYMDKNGFRYLTSDSDEPKQGDLIIVADVPKLWGTFFTGIQQDEAY